MENWGGSPTLLGDKVNSNMIWPVISLGLPIQTLRSSYTDTTARDVLRYPLMKGVIRLATTTTTRVVSLDRCDHLSKRGVFCLPNRRGYLTGQRVLELP